MRAWSDSRFDGASCKIQNISYDENDFEDAMPDLWQFLRTPEMISYPAKCPWSSGQPTEFHQEHDTLPEHREWTCFSVIIIEEFALTARTTRGLRRRPTMSLPVRCRNQRHPWYAALTSIHAMREEASKEWLGC